MYMTIASRFEISSSLLTASRSRFLALGALGCLLMVCNSSGGLVVYAGQSRDAWI